jgi:hypothetical protein
MHRAIRRNVIEPVTKNNSLIKGEKENGATKKEGQEIGCGK